MKLTVVNQSKFQSGFTFVWGQRFSHIKFTLFFNYSNGIKTHAYNAVDFTLSTLTTQCCNCYRGGSVFPQVR